MIDIQSLIILCEDGSSESRAPAKRLTKEERELLSAASEIGEFYLFSADQVSDSWVKAGSRHFLDEKNPAYAVKYLKAFMSLCKRGYISYNNNKLFVLNDSGSQKAKNLRVKAR